MSQLNNVFVEAFLTKKPKEGISIVQARLKDSMALDMELAEYFKERALIEENYAKSLSKASKRLYTMDAGVLGHFAPIWELLLKEFNQIAAYHSEMAYKITQDIEKPLRGSPSNDYDKLQQMEPWIHSLQHKNKLGSVRGSIFRKPSSASLSPTTWETDGAEYLTLNQNIDQARLNRLKQSVEKFEQLQSDQLMKRVELANMTLSAAEVFDIQHDIRDFCMERGKGLVTIQQRALDSSHDSLRSTTSGGNKFKSVFMKKKNRLSINEPQYGYSTTGDTFNNNSTISDEPPSINSMVSSTVDHHQRQQSSSTLPIATPSSIDSPSNHASLSNNAPSTDPEGYIIPAASDNLPSIASDIYSSRNTSDDFDSDYQSMNFNQRLQINIQNETVKDQDAEATETFNKMASILRERTPTITRRARGRRESALIRSQTDFSVINDPRSNSVVSPASSNETGGSKNPFMQQLPASPRATVTLVDPPISNPVPWQLQPIFEDQQQPEVSFSILETTSMTDEKHVLMVQGQISITYHGPNKPVQINLFQLDGTITPNTDYITITDKKYILNTTHIPQDQPTVCFTYQLELPGDGRWNLPIHLAPSWKCVPGVTYLMIKHSKNVAYNHNIKGSVQVKYDNVTTVQSTPQGMWDLKRLTWQFKDLFDQYAESQQGGPRLLAKFFVEEGVTASPQPIYLNYLVKDQLASKLTIQVLDEQGRLIKQLVETAVQSENIVIV